MNNIKSYDYNRKAEALLGHTKDGTHMIMRRADPRWKELGGAAEFARTAIRVKFGTDNHILKWEEQHEH